MKPITNEFLESLAFSHEAGYPPVVRILRTSGHEIESWPQNADGTGERRWYLNGHLIHPKPETQADVKQLLRRLRR